MSFYSLVSLTSMWVIYAWFFSSMIWLFGSTRHRDSAFVQSAKMIYDYVLPWVAPIYGFLFLLDCIRGYKLLAFMHLLVAVMVYIEWRRNKNDRWKKLRNKIKAKVAVGQAGLVVVPA